MKDSRKPTPAEETIAQEAAQWVLRQDRGLSAEEQDGLSQWLAADPRHRAALAGHRWGWEELDRLAGIQTSVHAVPDPDLLAPPQRWLAPVLGRFGLWAALPLAAALAVGLAFWRGGAPAAAPARVETLSAPLAGPIPQHILEDGSVVELNRGAQLAVEYSPRERRVRLERGEAHFQVAKNRERPFVVRAGGVAVRAVGTAFDVRLADRSVDVLVSEGRVRVDHAAGPRPGVRVPALDAGQRAVLEWDKPGTPAEVTTLTDSQVEERLAWRPRLLDFTDAPLGQIAREFNRHNTVRLVIGDPELAGVRLSVSFRSDNAEGFVRLLQSDFAVRATRRGDFELVLSHEKSP